MADAYWRYASDQRQHPPPPAGPHPGSVGGAPPAALQMAAAAGGQQPMKRPRPADFSDAPGAPDMNGYYPGDEETAGYHAARENNALAASYEHFLRTGQIQSHGAAPGGEPIRPSVGGNVGYPAARGVDSRSVGNGGGGPETPLPPDASNTLFIEGVPTDCTRREVSHIFRPFVGFREVRLVNKEAKHPGGDPIVLCFVDFADAAQAAIALEALKGGERCNLVMMVMNIFGALREVNNGYPYMTCINTHYLFSCSWSTLVARQCSLSICYKFDEHDRNSPHLRLQYARFTGPRGAGGARVRR